MTNKEKIMKTEEAILMCDACKTNPLTGDKSTTPFAFCKCGAVYISAGNNGIKRVGLMTVDEKDLAFNKQDINAAVQSWLKRLRLED